MDRDLALAATLGGLVGLAALTLAVVRVPLRAAPATALTRAAVQLAVIAGVLGLAFASPAVAALMLAVMLTAVGVTAGRRLGRQPRRIGQVLVAAVAGAVPAVLLLLGPGAFPRSPRYVIAFSGIVLGGTLTACTLAGRRLRERVGDRWSEVEGWLALGATPRQAVQPFLPSAVREALLPAVDQTRTTGLVTLPGAFVGSLAGGASPADAARFQLAVLAGILAAQAVSAVVLLRLLAPELAVAPEAPRAGARG